MVYYCFTQIGWIRFFFRQIGKKLWDSAWLTHPEQAVWQAWRTPWLESGMRKSLGSGMYTVNQQREREREIDRYIYIHILKFKCVSCSKKQSEWCLAYGLSIAFHPQLFDIESMLYIYISNMIYIYMYIYMYMYVYIYIYIYICITHTHVSTLASPFDNFEDHSNIVRDLTTAIWRLSKKASEVRH